MAEPLRYERPDSARRERSPSGAGSAGVPAAQYGNLGLIYGTRGDLERAEEMHRKALEIDEKLGLLEGMAGDYANLGTVFKNRGDVEQARELWVKARELYERIGMPHRVEKVQGWLDDLSRSDDPVT